MAIDYAQLKIDDAAGHPVTGAFDADPKTATIEWNAQNRPAEGGVDGMLNYCLKNRSRKSASFERTSIMGRIVHVAESQVDDDPFLTAVESQKVKLETKHAAQLFVTLFMSPWVSTLDFLDTEVDEAYTLLETAQVWKSSDTIALKGLSANQQSYASELGYRKLHTNDIITARALP